MACYSYLHVYFEIVESKNARSLLDANVNIEKLFYILHFTFHNVILRDHSITESIGGRTRREVEHTEAGRCGSE